MIPKQLTFTHYKLRTYINMVVLNIYLLYIYGTCTDSHTRSLVRLEMATHEKQRKSRFMNFYKFSSSSNKGYKPKPEPVIVASEPRKSLDRQETVVAGRRSIDYNGGGGFVEARKSVSQVESNVVSAAAFLQVKVMVSDMPGFMQVHAFRCARRTYDSLEKFSSKHMAYNIKKEFDKVYGPAWHCIVGSNFGSFVTHATGCFLYFSMEKLYILVFKTKVQKVLDS